MAIRAPQSEPGIGFWPVRPLVKAWGQLFAKSRDVQVKIRSSNANISDIDGGIIELSEASISNDHTPTTSNESANKSIDIDSGQLEGRYRPGDFSMDHQAPAASSHGDISQEGNDTGSMQIEGLSEAASIDVQGPAASSHESRNQRSTWSGLPSSFSA
eukprot:CAMPEP_0172624014 /NCGR_PEP_ID=MMETSP1068-20121228/133246_1 /TAXON_ID=35684 /ORGANISM="Pseudopedinella elastica, Strain CCMP716" /LENGTH=157 /DNA_ID=CAMNT_0013432799 /DNA_START=250 /DNA_END=723 /DNA_ORIENTATION=-